MRNHFKEVHIPTLSQSVDLTRLYGTLKTVMPPPDSVKVDLNILKSDH